jgi:WD40 repeat protein
VRHFSARIAGIRRGFFLLTAALFFLALAIGFAPTRVEPQTDSATGLIDPPAEIPIVAIRGEALAQYEEPLPPGARVRFGSTRFRHPKGLDRWQAEIAGPYFLSREGGVLTLTDIATGRRTWNRSTHFGGHDCNFHSVTASADGRVVAWRFGFLPESRIVAQIFEAVPDPVNPLRLIAALRIPETTDTDFVNAVFLPEDDSEIWILAGGIHAFDSKSGQLLRHVRTKNRILAMDQRGTRFLTSSEHDPRFVLMHGGFGRFHVPTYGFRPKNHPESVKRAVRRLGGIARPEKPDTDTLPLTLTVANARTGEAIFGIAISRVRGNEASHLDLSPDGRYLSFESDSCLTVFDVDRAEPVLELDTLDEDSSARRASITESWFSDDSRRFTVVGPNIAETQFNLATGLEVTRRGEPPLKPGFSGLGRRNAVVSAEGVLRRPDGDPPVGYAGVLLAYSPEQRLIAVGDATGRLDVWHQDGRLVRTLRAAGKGIAAITFSHNGTQLAMCDRDRVIRIWTVGSWREVERINVPANHDELYPEHLVFSPDDLRLLICRDDILALWDLGTHTCVWDVEGSGYWSMSSRPAFLPDGSRIMCPGRNSWLDAETGQSIVAIGGNDVNGHEQSIKVYRWREGWSDSAMAVCRDGSQIARIDRVGLLQTAAKVSSPVFRNFPEGKSISKRHAVLRYSRDGRRLVTCDDRGNAHVWEVASGQLAFTLAYAGGAIHDVHFGHDGRSLITSNHREVIVWDLLPDPGASTDPWADLGHDAPRAEQARRALLTDPTAAVALLRAKLRPATPLNDADISRLIRWLDADDYPARERAVAGLLAVGHRVLPRLKETKLTSDEGIARLAAVVRDLSAGPTSSELRQVRSIEVLEQIGTPAARDLITKLAAGDPAAALTEEARRTVQASKRIVQQITRTRANSTKASSTTAQPVMTYDPPHMSIGVTTASGSPSR